MSLPGHLFVVLVSIFGFVLALSVLGSMVLSYSSGIQRFGEIVLPSLFIFTRSSRLID